MEKLAMCRICLVANDHILAVNKNLHEVYEKLTDIPFVTEDRRPMLACFICCAKLKQCYRLLRQCLEAEKLLAQMMNEDYEPNPLINQDHLQLFSGFVKTPTENISIVDVVQTESIALKEELLSVVCERLDDIIEPKEEHQSDELEPHNYDNSESDLEDDKPLMEFKTEVEEEQAESKNKRRASETSRFTFYTMESSEAKLIKLAKQKCEIHNTVCDNHCSEDKNNQNNNHGSENQTVLPVNCNSTSLSQNVTQSVDKPDSKPGDFSPADSTDEFKVSASSSSSSSNSSSSSEDVNEKKTTVSASQALVAEESLNSADIQPKPKKSQKRTRNPNNWKKNRTKMLRNSGQPYVSSRGKTVSGKSMGPTCSETCRHSCSKKITEKERLTMFKTYWELGNLQRQRDFLSSCVKPLKMIYRRIKVDGNKEPRNPNSAYYITHEGIEKRVCKLFLINTLNIGERTLRTVIKAKSENMCAFLYRRKTNDVSSN